MNKLLFAALMLAGSVQGVHAEEAFAYPYLTFQTTDGTQQSVAAESLEITIEGSELVAQNATSGVRILLTQLEKMYFTANPSGIEAVEVAQARTVEVYTPLGVRVGSFATAREAAEALQGGIYVIKTDGVTRKIAVK